MKRIKIFTVVGARPQFIKAAALSRCFRKNFPELIEESIVHTGQHYDAGMSDVFFEELEIPQPAFRIQSGSGGHGKQTARMLEGLEQIFLEQNPDVVLVYGDTNSTLAGALAASKLSIPLVHVEAGLRSFNKAMPEEINRILTDHVSTLLFSPTQTGIKNLCREGFQEHTSGPFHPDRPGIFMSGDVMFDNALYFREKAFLNADGWFQSLGLEKGNFLLATVHRNLNTDNPKTMKTILQSFREIARRSGQKIFWPLHPRTRKMLNEFVQDDAAFQVVESDGVILSEPLGYLPMVYMEAACSLVLTDSGGVQKEAYFYQKPCVVLRSETEWTELVTCGAACLADPVLGNFSEKAIVMLEKGFNAPDGFYGNGKAAESIAGNIADNLLQAG
jgi:UDP-GlcNAc3NAcA epimerase